MASFSVAIHHSDETNNVATATNLKSRIDAFTKEGHSWSATLFSQSTTQDPQAGYDLTIWNPSFWVGYWDAAWDAHTGPVLLLSRNVNDEAHMRDTNDPNSGAHDKVFTLRSGVSHPIIDASGVAAGTTLTMGSKYRAYTGPFPAGAVDLATGVDSALSKMFVVDTGGALFHSVVAPNRRGVMVGNSWQSQPSDFRGVLEGMCMWLVGAIGVAAGVEMYDGSTYVDGSVELYDGSAWVPAVREMYDGSAWV